MINDLVSPIFANKEKSLELFEIAFAASYPPFAPKVTIPLCPFGKYLSAKALYLLDSNPG